MVYSRRTLPEVLPNCRVFRKSRFQPRLNNILQYQQFPDYSGIICCLVAESGPEARKFKSCLAPDEVDQRPFCGYTNGMKTAVSIPDKVFTETERLVRHLKKSRSEVYSLALAEYVARHAPERVTEAMDRVCTSVGQETDEFAAAAARRTLERSEW